MKAGVVEPIACANETGMNRRETLPRTTAAQKVAARTAILDLAGLTFSADAEEEEEEEEGEGEGCCGVAAFAASFSLTLSASKDDEEAEEDETAPLRLSRLSSQGSQTFPSSAHAPMCSSVSSSGLLNPKLESRARFIRRMPVLAAYQAATTRKVRTESRERKGRGEEEGVGGFAQVFAWRRRDENDDDDDDNVENGLPKNAATEPTSEEEDEAAAELPRAGEDKGGGRNDDGEGFSWRG